ncbi:MAG: flagellin [Microthrixaceae bacterium]
MRINHNIEAFNSWRNLTMTNTAMSKSLEKLSSGYRINRAADDASGLVISQGLRAQVSGLQQATRNSQDGISVLQTAEGALNEVHSILNRMRDLAVQASNTATNDTTARNATQAEVDALSAEITRISGATKFGQQALLNGTFGATAAQASGFSSNSSVTLGADAVIDMNIDGAGSVSATIVAGTYTGTQLAAAMQASLRAAITAATGIYTEEDANAVTVSAKTVGAGFSITVSDQLASGDTFTLADGTGTLLGTTLQLGTPTAASGTAATFQVGANQGDTISVSLADVSAAGLGVNSLDLVNNAAAAISLVDSAIASVSSTRGDIGAVQNRFEHTINNLQVATENLSASESRIRDTDMALEMTNYTRQQVLMQAGTAMLGQANQLPNSILALLR